MSADMICKICSLKESHPGVHLGEDRVCNLCKLDVSSELVDNFKYTRDRYDDFLRSPPNPRGAFDCLLMYSGGKDSTFMLDKFVNKDARRVLAYTFDVPFESARAAENVALARQKISATFMLDKDDRNIKRMMQEVFGRPRPKKPGKYLDEKLPCVACRMFFVLRAILYAAKHEIPFVVLCADPQQILTMESNPREMAKEFYRLFGRELSNELFDGAVEELLFMEDEQLPKVVFPFVEMRHRYDPDRIIAELKAKGLYQSSPIETHCTLFPLLNYYSFKNWDCMFYKLNASSHVRLLSRNKDSERSTYSMKLPRALDVLDLEVQLKTTLFEIADGTGDREQHEQALLTMLKDLGATDEAAQFAAQNCLDMHKVAADNGIELCK